MSSENKVIEYSQYSKYSKSGFVTYTSGNKKIDNFIQERQLKIKDHDDVVFEWIPYNQFDKIIETGKSSFMTVYSAIWRDGPLYKKDKWSQNYTRDSNKEVALKFLHKSLNSIEFVINEVNKYPTGNHASPTLYGTSQSPDTNDYILVFNWTSGNEKIDNFIQEMQLKIIDHEDVVFEWIPYNQFNEIEEIGKNNSITMYSAIWRDGPLYKEYSERKCYIRDSNKEVALKFLHNSQNSTEFVINEVKKYSTKNDVFSVLYGISQNSVTNDYILILKQLMWISDNEKIDDFIQERQLKVKDHNDVVFEWIPYNQFDQIKEISKSDIMALYSAIWKNGPLHKRNRWSKNYIRDSNKGVTLKFLHNSLNSIEFVINEIKKYSTKNDEFLILYGISQNPDTNDYILVFNWTSGNEKIDNFIQKRQLQDTDYDDVVFEWIQYSQFSQIKEICKNGTLYTAIWRDGPLYKKYIGRINNYTRNSNNEVVLKVLHNSQNSIEFVIKKIKKYSTKNNEFFGNEKIDNLIQERQLKNKDHDDVVFEWIPYNQFDKIIETGKSSFMTVYSAIWRDGPLHKWNKNYTRDSNKEVALKFLHTIINSIEFVINEVKKYSTKNDEFLVMYGISQNPDTNDYILVQNNYINLTNWISGNEKIDNLIQERQLKIKDHDDVVFEWIPYNQFDKIIETGKSSFMTVYSAIWRDGPLHKWNKNYTRDSNKEVALKFLHTTINSIEFVVNEVKKYSTKNDEFLVLYGISQNPDTNDYILVQNNYINLTNWISGNEKIDNLIQERQLKIKDHDDVVFEWIPYNQFDKIIETGKSSFMTVYSAIWRDGPLHKWNKNYIRDSNKEVALKFLHTTINSIEFVVNEVKKYSTKNDEFLIFGNEKIDNLIQERQLKIKDHDDVVFEWIPYNQFDKIIETGKSSFMTVHSAIWKNGPLYKKDKWSQNYTRDSNKEVALKFLHNSQNSIEFVINEAKKYSTKNDKFLVLYGISQNLNTNDYILVQNSSINLTNWISGNEKIDNFIQERQLKVKDYNNVVFEWIPYNQFDRIIETGKSSFMTVSLATWRNGPLCKKNKWNNYIRDSNEDVALKFLHNSQNSIEFVINEFLILYGISQNPDTNDYILVLKRFIWISGNEKIDNFIQERQLKVKYCKDVVFEWIPYNHFDQIKKIGKNDLLTVYSAIWKYGPLCKKDELSSYYIRDSNKEVALKLLHNSQDSIEFVINEV
ncbi:unnamed protein product [Rhizophagus irregularis]|nr:unnamed protein product [Rhizophagus irregularis]